MTFGAEHLKARAGKRTDDVLRAVGVLRVALLRASEKPVLRACEHCEFHLRPVAQPPARHGGRQRDLGGQPGCIRPQ